MSLILIVLVLVMIFYVAKYTRIRIADNELVESEFCKKYCR